VCLVQIGWGAELKSDVEIKEGASKRLLVSRIMAVRSQDSAVVAVERDPLSGALRIRGVKAGKTVLHVDFRDSGVTEKVGVRVLASSKRKKSVKTNSFHTRSSLFEMPGW
jgi:hypothetical protein